MIAWGVTLTMHDEMEPGAYSNFERIATMRILHDAGFRTFASIEPVIDFASAFSAINITRGICDLYKIGLMSGRRYTRSEFSEGHFLVSFLAGDLWGSYKVYLKDSLVDFLNLHRQELPAIFVDRDYNIFCKF